eukprot:TRINITY_DN1512_c0_g1_i1.p1 TRINITY_DN1512_c0_g1~~TRINITY_DN1512_c0_g1_i1.p1  ORF type:complete len:367 (+),score=73.47 TRINITY_DN1512_c0_g1_i1:95-1195(+)
MKRKYTNNKGEVVFVFDENKHQKSKTGKDQYWCRICKKFVTYGDASTHCKSKKHSRLLENLGKQLPNKFYCEECGKEFNTSGGKSNHKKRNHGVLKDFVIHTKRCTACNITLRDKSAYDTHKFTEEHVENATKKDPNVRKRLWEGGPPVGNQVIPKINNSFMVTIPKEDRIRVPKNSTWTVTQKDEQVEDCDIDLPVDELIEIYREYVIFLKAHGYYKNHKNGPRAYKWVKNRFKSARDGIKFGLGDEVKKRYQALRNRVENLDAHFEEHGCYEIDDPSSDDSSEEESIKTEYLDYLIYLEEHPYFGIKEKHDYYENQYYDIPSDDEDTMITSYKNLLEEVKIRETKDLKDKVLMTQVVMIIMARF